MSRVYLATEARLGRQVVIKVLPPEMSAAVNVERFEREIKLAARLQHPHIVPLLTAAAAGDLLYYIMPFIEGESLRAKLAREGELPVAEAAKIMREVVDALSYAHRSGVVHRDIKPDNVLLSDGHAVVTDFGVAKAVTASSGKSSLTSSAWRSAPRPTWRRSRPPPIPTWTTAPTSMPRASWPTRCSPASPPSRRPPRRGCSRPTSRKCRSP
ncbi:MAG: serine/threonine protein kinase [Gemmatimonadetes bacterium]|nr:serine/threonine protein kinase [Gemmatimonadota bacterium]